MSARERCLGVAQDLSKLGGSCSEEGARTIRELIQRIDDLCVKVAKWITTDHEERHGGSARDCPECIEKFMEDAKLTREAARRLLGD